MARLGEHLVAANLVAPAQLDQALRAQVVWGGRLGTNLVELGCIDLDGVSRALGQLHGIPAALQRHFDRADPALQALLPADVADLYSVVPLVRLSAERVAVVAVDPLRRSAADALAKIFGVDPRTGLLFSVAAEMRVLYHLERIYGIPRPARFLRTRGTTNPPFPQLDNVPEIIDTDTDLAVPIAIDESSHPTGRAELAGDPDDVAAQIDNAIDGMMTPSPDAVVPAGRDRRGYVRALGEPVEDSKPEHLGRMAIKRVAVSSRAATMEVGTTGPSTLAEATRAIKRGHDRNGVAELAIETLDRFVTTCAGAVLLVIRGQVAIGWKYFMRHAESAPETAVRLDVDGLARAAVAGKHTTRGAPSELGGIDPLLLRELACTTCDLVIAPVKVGESVVCLVAAAVETGADSMPVEAVAAAVATAFTRLIRDASR